MVERRYTISEIDRIRAGVRKQVEYPGMISYSCPPGGGMAVITPESRAALSEYERQVEDRVRTALIGGVDPTEFPKLKTDEE